MSVAKLRAQIYCKCNGFNASFVLNVYCMFRKVLERGIERTRCLKLYETYSNSRFPFQYGLCDPCTLHYDYILSLENLERETEILLERVRQA